MPDAAQTRFIAGLVLRLGLLIGVILVAGSLVHQVITWLDLDMPPHDSEEMRKFVAVGLAAYVGLTALPFVPGAEIGMILLSLFGAAIAPLVYAATVVSLCLAYGIGWLVPPTVTARLLARVGLNRAAELVSRTSGLARADRMDFLLTEVDSRHVQFLTRYRYVALALMINMPGNIILGGGGGLAMFAGLSGLYAPLPFLLTILIAVVPVPLIILMMGA